MKFVSLSQLLGCPLFRSHSGLFTVPGFLVSLVVMKKKKDGKKKRYKGRERRSRTRKKEREEEGIKRKEKITIKNYLKKNKPACQASFAGVFGCN